MHFDFSKKKKEFNILHLLRFTIAEFQDFFTPRSKNGSSPPERNFYTLFFVSLAEDQWQPSEMCEILLPFFSFFARRGKTHLHRRCELNVDEPSEILFQRGDLMGSNFFGCVTDYWTSIRVYFQLGRFNRSLEPLSFMCIHF